MSKTLKMWVEVTVSKSPKDPRKFEKIVEQAISFASHHETFVPDYDEDGIFAGAGEVKAMIVSTEDAK